MNIASSTIVLRFGSAWTIISTGRLTKSASIAPAWSLREDCIVLWWQVDSMEMSWYPEFKSNASRTQRRECVVVNGGYSPCLYLPVRPSASIQCSYCTRGELSVCHPASKSMHIRLCCASLASNACAGRIRHADSSRVTLYHTVSLTAHAHHLYIFTPRRQGPSLFDTDATASYAVYTG